MNRRFETCHNSLLKYIDSGLEIATDTVANTTKGLFTWREGAPANPAVLGGLTSHTFL